MGLGDDKKMVSPFMSEISEILTTLEKDDFTTEVTQKMDRIRIADL